MSMDIYNSCPPELSYWQQAQNDGHSFSLPPPCIEAQPAIFHVFGEHQKPIMSGIGNYERKLIYGLLSTTSNQKVTDNIAKLNVDELQLLARKVEAAAFIFNGANGSSLADIADQCVLPCSPAAKSMIATKKSNRGDKPPPLYIDKPTDIPTPPPSAGLARKGSPDLQSFPPPKKQKIDVEEQLFLKLEIKHPLPPENSKRCKKPAPRSQKFRDLVMQREQERCLLTGCHDESSGGEAAHILPHHVCSIYRLEVVVFWQILAFLFPENIRDTIYRLAGGKNANNPANGIFLRHDVHRHFDKGNLYILPLLPLALVPYPAVPFADFNILWKGDSIGLKHLRTEYEDNLEEQHCLVEGEFKMKPQDEPRSMQYLEARRVVSQSIPAVPLPSSLLLEVNVRLWELVFHAGLVSTFKKIDDRIAKYTKTANKGRRKQGGENDKNNGDSDDDHGDGDDEVNEDPYDTAGGSAGERQSKPDGARPRPHAGGSSRDEGARGPDSGAGPSGAGDTGIGGGKGVEEGDGEVDLSFGSAGSGIPKSPTTRIVV